MGLLLKIGNKYNANSKDLCMYQLQLYQKWVVQLNKSGTSYLAWFGKYIPVKSPWGALKAQAKTGA